MKAFIEMSPCPDSKTRLRLLQFDLRSLRRQQLQLHIKRRFWGERIKILYGAATAATKSCKSFLIWEKISAKVFLCLGIKTGVHL